MINLQDTIRNLNHQFEGYKAAAEKQFKQERRYLIFRDVARIVGVAAMVCVFIYMFRC